MKKSRLSSLFALFFATFLVLATVETLTQKDETTPVNAVETQTLEVPLTGETRYKRTAETYETLFEIAFLALIGTGFYVLNTRRRH
jgi:hypothetical protein